jgi:hypothetical protein
MAEEQPACFVVRDHNGQRLAYVYFIFEDEPGRRSARPAEKNIVGMTEQF